MPTPPITLSANTGRGIPQAFECRPTAPGLLNDELPDELMINWGGLPSGAMATIYLPAVAADDVLELAGRLYNGRPFTKLDAHTVGLHATGLTYFPIPPGPLPGPNFAGLLTITLPPGLSIGQRVTVTVQQITNVERSRGEDILLPYSPTNLRQLIGAFQLNVTIQSAASLLVPTEQSFAFFQWVVSTLPVTDRWYPVLIRYLGEIAANVGALGGNPHSIPPSPTGSLPGSSHHHPPPHHGALLEHTGKVESIFYDRFGDFEGFVLKTEKGDKIHYHSREIHIAELVRSVWVERIRVTIFSSHHEPHVPVRFMLHS